MTASRARSSALRSRAPVLFLAALATAVALQSVVLVLANRVALQVVHGAWLRLELFVLFAALGLALAALVSELQELRRAAPRARPLAPIGALLVVLVAGWAALLAFVQPFQRLWLDLALGAAAGTWSGLLLLERRVPAPTPRALSLAGRTLLAASAALVLLEVGLRAFDAFSPSPLLARVGDAPRRGLERFRGRPGEVRYGFPCNSRGYYDEEFFAKRPGEVLVASIGDSFNVGAVPHAQHMTSVCERELSIPVHNFGVAGAGPPEYLAMLADEALPLAPDLVLIQVFVGNDLAYGDVEEGRPHAALRSWLERDRVLFTLLVERLARVRAERERLAEHVRSTADVRGERTSSAAVATSPAETRLADPQHDDPLEVSTSEDATRPRATPADPTTAEESLDAVALPAPTREDASLSEPAYLRLETRRALEVCRGVPSSFDALCRTLSAARRACGSTRFAVVLVPDEFQVEDALWQRIVESTRVELDRDAPQRRLRGWLAGEGISVLDLLPVLRAVPPLADGDRHLYHLRDTHFNARGNHVAGLEIARFVEDELAR